MYLLHHSPNLQCLLCWSFREFLGDPQEHQRSQHYWAQCSPEHIRRQVLRMNSARNYTHHHSKWRKPCLLAVVLTWVWPQGTLSPNILDESTQGNPGWCVQGNQHPTLSAEGYFGPKPSLRWKPCEPISLRSHPQHNIRCSSSNTIRVEVLGYGQIQPGTPISSNPECSAQICLSPVIVQQARPYF